VSQGAGVGCEHRERVLRSTVGALLPVVLLPFESCGRAGRLFSRPVTVRKARSLDLRRDKKRLLQ
jgi:hypothetical protein